MVDCRVSDAVLLGVDRAMKTAFQSFPTEDVLGAFTGILLSDIGGIYRVLNWMTGEQLFTHQLPRVGREAAPVLLAAYPELAQAEAEARQVTTENYKTWRDVWIKRYGSHISVPKFSTDEHEQIDALSELAEKVHPDNIVVVKS